MTVMLRLVVLLAGVALLAGCAGPAGTAVSTSSMPSTRSPGPAAGARNRLTVLAAETYLADIAQNVVGDRARVDALIPIGVDPHSFEPTPADVRKVAGSNVLIINGAGFESFLAQLLENAGGERIVVEASKGLQTRAPQPGERAEAAEAEADQTHEAGDPHFWLDPTKVVTYVHNIRDALAAADPESKDVYAANAETYIDKLNDLDTWIKQQVTQIPEARRLLVTNHESFGYFADHYGFRIVGTIVPSVSTAASPSARGLARLADEVKATGAPVVFLETGSNTQLAGQLAGETGIKVVTGLLTHSVTEPNGPAPDYLGMMRHNVNAIVAALK